MAAPTLRLRAALLLGLDELAVQPDGQDVLAHLIRARLTDTSLAQPVALEILTVTGLGINEMKEVTAGIDHCSDMAHYDTAMAIGAQLRLLPDRVYSPRNALRC